MPRLVIDFAVPGDAPELSRLLSESTRGGAMPPFALDRPHDIFRIMDVRGTEWKLLVARDTASGGRLAAYASVAYRPTYVNGELRRTPHLLDVFFAPEYRRGTLLARSFAFVREHAIQGDDYAQTQVCIDNRVALGAFTSGRCGLPAYLPYGDHAFITAPLAGGNASADGAEAGPGKGFEVRRAVPGDEPAMQAFFDRWAPSKQFYPHYDFTALHPAHGNRTYYRGLSWPDFFLAFRNGRLAGLLGTWDQQEFKSTHYLGGNGEVTLAPAAGGAGRMDGGSAQAAGDGADRPLFLHCILTEGNSPKIFAALLAAVRREFAGSAFGFCALGLDARDGLRYALDALPHRVSVTHHFLVSYGNDPRPGLKPGYFYLESARC